MSSQEQFLEEVGTNLKAQTLRLQTAVKALEKVQLNDAPSGGLSVAQIIEHMRISHLDYADALDKILEGPILADVAPKLSWIGTQFAKVAGPDGNANIPKRYQPDRKTYGLEVVHQYVELQNRIVGLSRKFEDVDLNKNYIRNPIFGFIKFNIADVFHLLVQHNERHIRQVEARIK